MRKRNKKAIIITAVLMLIGILLVLAGFFGGWFIGLFAGDFDYKNIKPEDMGRTVKTDVVVYYDDIDLQDKTLQVLGSINSDDFKFILLDISRLSEKDKNIYYSKVLQHITLTGRLRAVDETEFREVEESLYRLYDSFIQDRIERAAKKKNYTDAEKKDLEKLLQQTLSAPVIPYCIEVESISSFNWMPFIPAGAVLFLLSLVLDICFIFKLKKRIVLPVAYGLMVIVPTVMFFGHIRTMLTVKKVSDGFYTIKNLECTDTQGLLDSGSADVDSMLSWVFKRHFYGISFGINEKSLGFGCSAFASVTPDGKHLFGRNFDFPETDTLLIYSHPEGAYESIGIADIGLFGVSQNSLINPDSPLGRFVMVATPYFVVDGMNEKGVGAGILQLDLDETHQDKGKPDLIIFCAIRAILDKCASVDEALELLKSFDVHSGLESDYHLFITDRSGKYVVVEWLDGEMVVTEHPCCTNSIVAPGKYYNKGTPDNRLPTMEACLGAGRTTTDEEAMAILEKVKNKKLTEWSCVYNLDDFTVSICLDADYTKVYTFSAKDLK